MVNKCSKLYTAIERYSEEWEQIPLFGCIIRRKKLASIEDKVQNLIQKDIKDLGYNLYDVEYVKEGKEYYLRIYIQNEDGITLDDCEKVNNSITDKLDEADYIKEQYFLEVSSCGLEKNLRKDEHLRDTLGKEVGVKLYKPIERFKRISRNIKKLYTRRN